MSTLNTHPLISPEWVGSLQRLAPGEATCTLTTRPEMAADDRGLVHGGFTFGLADYAAMAAVNDPNVVLGKAEVRFTAPSVVGDVLRATATGGLGAGSKRIVEVEVLGANGPVFKGTFTCYILDRHVLDKS